MFKDLIEGYPQLKLQWRNHNNWSENTERIAWEKCTEEQQNNFNLREVMPTEVVIDLDFSDIDNWSEENMFVFAKKLREYSKPIIIAANKIDKPLGEELLHKIKNQYKEKIIPCSALAEFWLRKLAEKEIIRYLPGDDTFEILKSDQLTKKERISLDSIHDKILKKYGSTGIQELLNHAVFNILKQIIVYPVYDINSYSDKDGNVLPDAHLIKKGMELREFVAQKVHTELAEHFIYGLDARTKLRLSESYELKNNDIVKIVSAAK